MGRRYPFFFLILTLCFLPIKSLYAATYNATGIWTSSSYDSWVNPGNAGCVKDPDRTVTTIIDQSGDTVSFVTDGILYTGTVSGTVYTVSSSLTSDGGTTTITYQITLTSPTDGSGTTTWSWTDGYYSCNGGNSFTVTKQQEPPVHNATGIWYYSNSENWASGCSADPPNYGYLAIIQNSDTFTYTDQLGIYTGRIAGAEYLSSLRYFEDGGYTTQLTHTTLLNDYSGIGTNTWTWTDGYYSCYGGSIIFLWKQPTDVTYDASGKWTYATGETSGTLTISQDNNEFRINGYNGTHSGLISSENYIAIASYPSNNGTMTESILFTLSSGTAAEGAIERYWTNGYLENWSSEALSLTKTSTLNTAPDAPLLSFPADGAKEISNTPVLQTGKFSDPDSGDRHSQTEWQISASIDFSSQVLVTTSNINLTSLTVPEFTLYSGNQYWWRVKFYDNNLEGSKWSSTGSFTVTGMTNDANNNGIPDNSENSTVDLDNDGTTDINQAELIKSMNTVIGNGQMGASRKDDPNISSIDSINSIDPASISSVARPSNMSLGMINLELSVVRPTDTADVKIYFSQAAPANSNWYMYDPISGWTDYSAKGLATFSTDRKSVTVRLKDWGHGDSDGIPNGTIVDPSGFGIASWVKGFVSDSATKKEITNATISFTDQNFSLNTLLEGNYLSMILPGTYDISVSAPGYQTQTLSNIKINEGDIVTKDIALTSSQTNDCIINAKINTQEKGYIDGVWKKGGEDTTSRGDRVVWGYFYADPNDVSWGSSNNPEVFVKIWYDAGGRVDVNFFHVSVPDIEVSSTYSGVDLKGTATMDTRYIRLYYNENGKDGKTENSEDGLPATGYNPANNPLSYPTINNLKIGATINTVEAAGSIDGRWVLGGQDTTTRGDNVVWGHFYADPNDVSWGSQNNPELFVKIWFDAGGRIDVNYFHVSVPDIEVYSDYVSDGVYDSMGTTIMNDRYIRHEYYKP